MALRMISPAQLKAALNSAAKPLLLDVREHNELAGPLGCLQNIVHIPLGSLSGRMQELTPSDEIVVICRSGARAVSAARLLTDAGFRKVAVLGGGMVAWNTSGAAR